MSILRKCLRPWLIVLIGVVLTVTSAFMSHRFVSKNMQTIQRLEKEAAQVDQTIASQWQDMGRFERDGNTALQLAEAVEDDPLNPPATIAVDDLKLYVRHFIQKSDVVVEKLRVEGALKEIDAGKKGMVFQSIMALVNAQQSHVSDTVNAMYLKKISLQEKIQQLQSENSDYSNKALLLQILGLVFVLSKDLVRREWPK